MSARRKIPNDARERQRRASDPQGSIWVAAHAGSGKTHVLTSRVVRLLLAGVSPSRILCLTYTKAAAANMATRVADLLARWALLDDAELGAAIEDMSGARPSSQDLAFARRLFARAVETPGGLKVQTIHAFCERLLRFFPFEANVSAGFRLVEDLERRELLERAKSAALLDAASGNASLADAFALVATQARDAKFDSLLNEALSATARASLFTDPEMGWASLCKRLGVAQSDSVETIAREMLEGGLHPNARAYVAMLLQGSASDKKMAGRLLASLETQESDARLEHYLGFFFTKTGAPRSDEKWITKGLREKFPDLFAELSMERERLLRLIERRRAVATAHRSRALSVVLDATLSHYERLKAARGLLDFDDLIEKTAILLTRYPSWVLYKLDQQVDHILLDEAQDTSAPQWDILGAIVDEFCSGKAARRRDRTFFAVGDEKQSIFSFQGAAPEKFDSQRRILQNRFAAAKLAFETVRLTYSFRSSQHILGAVDAVFAHADHRRGLAADPQEPPPQHVAIKSDLPGYVEIWEPIGAEAAAAPNDWLLPVDLIEPGDPQARLASKIARKIKALLDPAAGECVEGDGMRRSVGAGDIMILVRKRDAFFEAMIRALKREQVPVAGADRLALADHIAVMDLVALGRAALLPQDDLTLATVLKSPLIGLCDDDLITLAPRRPASLHQALRASPAHRDASLRVDAFIEAATRLSPFDFYSRALGAEGGRLRMLERLGAEANDAMDEFLRLALDFEQRRAGGLTAFLAEMEALDYSVKRDMESAEGMVRVMTAHAAKGLEAKIVFLPDTCGAPSGKHDPDLLLLGEEGDQSLVFAPHKAEDCQAVAQARAALRVRQEEEHRRLLYVALTRAEERLYIAGWHGKIAPGEGCWLNMIQSALATSCTRREDPEGGSIFSFGEAQRLDVGAGAAAPAPPRAIPDFALWPAPIEQEQTPPLRPSDAFAGTDDAARADAPVAAKRAQRLLRGRLTHGLLQHLPTCAPENRRAVGERFLALRGGELDAKSREKMLDGALAILDDPGLAPLFSSGAAAELDIVATIDTRHGPLSLAGRIDRFAESENEIFIAEFKTGAAPLAPTSGHLRQLALYRAAVAPLYAGKRLRCLLVYTQEPHIVEPESGALDAAFEAALR